MLTWLALGVAVFAVAFDFQNVIALWRGWVLPLGEETCDDYTVVVPLFGHPRYFDQRGRIAHMKQNVLVSLHVGNETMLAFADELEAEGWNVHRTLIANPSPPVLFLDAMHSGRITTRWLARLDADTVLEPLGMARAVAAAERDGSDICSVKVRVLDAGTLVERMQGLEYDMAMRSRHFRPWLTSGACFIARTDAAHEIMERHSRWFPGEDIETGRIAHALKLRIRHVDLEVWTEAPNEWKALLKQRRLWWAGAFRHNIINFDTNAVHMPLWTFYCVALIWSSLVLDWWHLPTVGAVLGAVHWLPGAFAVYLSAMLIANWPVRSRYMLLMPPYAFVQSLLMPFVGSVYYFMLAHRKQAMGRYRFGLRRQRIAIPGRAQVVASDNTLRMLG